MLIIVDNGHANDVAKCVRGKYSIASPKNIPSNGSAYILSDGDEKNQSLNVKFIQKTTKPVLGVGVGCIFIATAGGAKVKKVPKVQRSERLSIKKACPLTLDFKRNFAVMENYSHVIEELPENFIVAASSPKYEYEIIQDMKRPLFGVHFSPAALDGLRIVDNFVKFVGIWEKYHK